MSISYEDDHSFSDLVEGQVSAARQAAKAARAERAQRDESLHWLADILAASRESGEEREQREQAEAVLVQPIRELGRAFARTLIGNGVSFDPRTYEVASRASRRSRRHTPRTQLAGTPAWMVTSEERTSTTSGWNNIAHGGEEYRVETKSQTRGLAVTRNGNFMQFIGEWAVVSSESGYNLVGSNSSTGWRTTDVPTRKPVTVTEAAAPRALLYPTGLPTLEEHKVIVQPVDLWDIQDLPLLPPYAPQNYEAICDAWREQLVNIASKIILAQYPG